MPYVPHDQEKRRQRVAEKVNSPAAIGNSRQRSSSSGCSMATEIGHAVPLNGESLASGVTKWYFVDITIGISGNVTITVTINSGSATCVLYWGNTCADLLQYFSGAWATNSATQPGGYTRVYFKVTGGASGVDFDVVVFAT